MTGRKDLLCCRIVVSMLEVLLCVQLATSAGGQTIQDVRVFQPTGPPGTEVSLLVEIKGKDFPNKDNLRLLVDPLKGLTKAPEILSATDDLVMVRLTSAPGYFPATVGMARPNGAIVAIDVERNRNPNLPRIDEIEILKLDRELGSGRLKIIGANFGTDKKNLAVSIVPTNPELSAFAPITLPFTVYKQGEQKEFYCRHATPDEQAARPSVTDASDDTLVVDFSFPCNRGYSTPFRIARVVVTVPGPGTDPTSALHEMMLTRDRNLIYRYSILSKSQASSRFGGGIAKNFYVVQLSIVNRGTKKVQVPLASIQAEVEWASGQDPKHPKKYFLPGPPTVAPVPLTGAISFFSAHRKSSGNRAIFFNALQGLTTIGSAVQTFFAPGFTQGVAIAGGGFRQGAGQVFQDLSEEQLANLTAQSFETTETISGNGGSAEKVIFIQRGEEVMQPYTKDYKSSRVITNIYGFEITGYEVSETPGKGATPQQQP